MGAFFEWDFSIKSATWIQGINQEVNRKSLLSNMSNLKIPSKVKKFVWLFIQEKLQTRVRRSKYTQH